ncbi:hypothetical protein SCLCIDRAFT_23276 [Scleroderma citrinum Foug A]|uniref:Uncharacterized protein n=1 Tax=Scleroderma citrinum Foug A TaxID=1036808 RepID=A0A0C3AJ41_9AGAM|nr:hypothetical protein SCLCIDRAFT_23276 [Scleroderma citrinum Foug A]
MVALRRQLFVQTDDLIPRKSATTRQPRIIALIGFDYRFALSVQDFPCKGGSTNCRANYGSIDRDKGLSKTPIFAHRHTVCSLKEKQDAPVPLGFNDSSFSYFQEPCTITLPPLGDEY